jgi:hypothetical protein
VADTRHLGQNPGDKPNNPDTSFRLYDVEDFPKTDSLNLGKIMWQRLFEPAKGYIGLNLHFP